MESHQHAAVVYDEHVRETVEYISLSEAIRQKNSGVKLVDTHTEMIDNLKKKMQECS
jgi:hypothetical protein